LPEARIFQPVSAQPADKHGEPQTVGISTVRTQKDSIFLLIAASLRVERQRSIPGRAGGWNLFPEKLHSKVIGLATLGNAGAGEEPWA
jgi:hypothetical protein